MGLTVVSVAITLLVVVAVFVVVVVVMPFDTAMHEAARTVCVHPSDRGRAKEEAVLMVAP